MLEFICKKIGGHFWYWEGPGYEVLCDLCKSTNYKGSPIDASDWKIKKLKEHIKNDKDSGLELRTDKV
jgi:hypothetical protein